MAVKAEKLCSGPGAITWIHASDRACSVTSRALDVSRDKVLVLCIYERKEDKSWFSKQTPSRTQNCAHPHTHSMHTKIRPHWCSGVCVTARMQSLARWHRCCDRSQGEHLPHLPEPQRQQCGRRRRHSSRRGPAGNGSDVYAVLVQDICLFLARKSLHKIV